MPQPFEVRVEPHRETILVRVAGELDVATAPELNDRFGELLDVGFGRVVLDLRDTTFLDSSGLHCILRMDRKSRDAGATFELVPGPPVVQRVFGLTGTDVALRFIEPEAVELLAR
jgi:anti-anti-sigma factor